MLLRKTILSNLHSLRVLRSILLTYMALTRIYPCLWLASRADSTQYNAVMFVERNVIVICCHIIYTNLGYDLYNINLFNMRYSGISDVCVGQFEERLLFTITHILLASGCCKRTLTSYFNLSTYINNELTVKYSLVHRTVFTRLSTPYV